MCCGENLHKVAWNIVNMDIYFCRNLFNSVCVNEECGKLSETMLPLFSLTDLKQEEGKPTEYLNSQLDLLQGKQMPCSFLKKNADQSLVCLYLSLLVLQVLDLVLLILLEQLLQRFGDLKSKQGPGLTKLLQAQRNEICLMIFSFKLTWSLKHCVFVSDWPFWGTVSNCSSGSTVLRGMLTSSGLEVKSTE